MKPMTGVIRKRAKTGMTIPAAPRITSASLKPDVLEVRRAILPLCAGRTYVSHDRRSHDDC